MADNENRIVITDADLNAPKVVESVRAMQEAAAFTTVRSVGAPAPSGAGFKAILILTGAGLLGGLLAHVVQVIILDYLMAGAESKWINRVFTFIMALVIGTTVALIDAGTTRIAAKIRQAALIAIPTAVVTGFALGEVANLYFVNEMEKIEYEEYVRISNGESPEAVWASLQSAYHLPRGIAWMIVGIAAGITVGAASRSLKRTGLTVAGGAIGGFIGGFIFDYIGRLIGNDLGWVPQIVGITITGLLIGLAMVVLEQAARTQWIEIVEGGMAGKQFILYKNEITLGSSPTADITLIKDPSISPIHARIFAAGGRTQIESLDPNRPISVNGTVGLRIQLEDSVYITIGSTQVLFREKAGASKTVTGNVGRLS